MQRDLRFWTSINYERKPISVVVAFAFENPLFPTPLFGNFQGQFKNSLYRKDFITDTSLQSTNSLWNGLQNISKICWMLLFQKEIWIWENKEVLFAFFLPWIYVFLFNEFLMQMALHFCKPNVETTLCFLHQAIKGKRWNNFAEIVLFATIGIH